MKNIFCRELNYVGKDDWIINKNSIRQLIIWLWHFFEIWWIEKRKELFYFYFFFIAKPDQWRIFNIYKLRKIDYIIYWLESLRKSWFKYLKWFAYLIQSPPFHPTQPPFLKIRISKSYTCEVKQDKFLDREKSFDFPVNIGCLHKKINK